MVVPLRESPEGALACGRGWSQDLEATCHLLSLSHLSASLSRKETNSFLFFMEEQSSAIECTNVMFPPTEKAAAVSDGSCGHSRGLELDREEVSEALLLLPLLLILLLFLPLHWLARLNWQVGRGLAQSQVRVLNDGDLLVSDGDSA